MLRIFRTVCRTVKRMDARRHWITVTGLVLESTKLFDWRGTRNAGGSVFMLLTNTTPDPIFYCCTVCCTTRRRKWNMGLVTWRRHVQRRRSGSRSWWVSDGRHASADWRLGVHRTRPDRRPRRSLRRRWWRRVPGPWSSVRRRSRSQVMLLTAAPVPNSLPLQQKHRTTWHCTLVCK